MGTPCWLKGIKGEAIHIFGAFAELLAGAGAALPFIACLTLIAGRRGNALFCLWGGYRLLHLALILALAGPVWIVGSYLADVYQYETSLSQKLAPLFHHAGLPWSSSCLAWLGGWLAGALACLSLHRELAAFQGDRYRLAYILLPLLSSLVSSCFFLAAYVLINWPFAGLPAGLTWERASMAVIRRATRLYFMNFSFAGGFALLAAVYAARDLGVEQKKMAVRWLAAWACGGCFPGLIQSWGAVLGLGASGRLGGALSQGLWMQAWGNILLTVAFICWVLILWRPIYWRLLSITGACLLLFRTAAPFVVQGVMKVLA